MQCPPLSQRDVLEAFYDATGGPNWNNSDNWLTDAPLSQWYGVNADGSGNVTGLYLDWNFVIGRIPPELGGLSHLQDLYLGGNHFWKGRFRQGYSISRACGAQPLPHRPGWPSATGLSDGSPTSRQLNLTNAGVTGPIPKELGKLTNLRTLISLATT